MSNQENANYDSLDIVGIGNAIVDILVRIEESDLKNYSVSKGNMTLINEVEAHNLYNKIENSINKSGGSAANTLAGFSKLGGRAGFIGRVNNDLLGETFTKEIKSTGTYFKTSPSNKGPSTARCLILVTPDAERTMCTYLGASALLEPKDIDPGIIKNSEILYLEGYLFDAEAAKNAFYKAAKISKEYNKKVALSLSDSFCVNRHKESFLSLIKESVDILFSNESEIIALSESNSLEDALIKIKEICEIIVITLGDNGSIVISKDKKYKINPYVFGKVIDSTGAGDLYASGFLYGLIQKKDLETCGKIGSICAGHIVTQLGSRAEVSLQDLVKENL
ncbi:adenosine kinase [Prochlorococcus sp. MIT 1223]|uniref:adenosine kinase n=1 Tax=Prochlorococcus sp. MIT 1223 TaxID=3096217 RepID=UPI002A74BFCB|nr:adenosine kinase [Prochlorococcus sp. MIT 1223]